MREGAVAGIEFGALTMRELNLIEVLDGKCPFGFDNMHLYLNFPVIEHSSIVIHNMVQNVLPKDFLPRNR